MKSLVLLATLLSSNLWAGHHTEHFKGMIEIVSSSLGVRYQETTNEVSNGTSKIEVDVTNIEFGLNYAREVHDHIWLQGILTFERTKTEGVGTDNTEDALNLLIGGIYNFNHDATNSIFAKTGVTLQVREEEDSGKDEKIKVNGFFIEFGKRWSLEKIFGVKNIAYTASITYGFGSGDYEQTGVQTLDYDINGFIFKPLGISLFF